MKLTDKQIKFCQEYCVDLNATQAAIRAGYSENTAAAIGCENLIKPNIQTYIKKLQAESARALGITKNKILIELSKMGFLDPRKAFDESGKLLNVKEIPPDIAAAITSIETEELWGPDEHGEKAVIGVTRKVRFSDKRQSLDSLAKMLGFNAPEKSEIQITGITLVESDPSPEDEPIN